MDNSLNRKKGAAISMINMGVSLLIGLLYTPFLLRSFGKSEYGVYTLANSIISFIGILDLGFGNALVRYSARMRTEGQDDRNLNGMFLILFSAIAVLALVVGLIFMNNIESFFESTFTKTETYTLKIVFAVLLVNTVIAFPASVFSSIIRSHERFAWVNGLDLAKNILMHLVNIILMTIGYKSISIAIVSLIFTLIVLSLNIYYVFHVLKVKFGFQKFECSFYKEVITYSFFILLNMLVDRLYASTDKIILGKLCSSAAVAVYGVGVTFETYFTSVSTAISGVYLPHMSILSVEREGIKKMSSAFLTIGHIQYVFLSLIMTGFIAYGKTFIRVWAGEGYDSAYYIALIIMLPNIIPLSQNIGISILQAMNKHAVRSVMYLVIAIFNIVISIPLAMHYQGVGAAIGTAVGMLLGQVFFMNWYYWKRIGINIPGYWRQTAGISVKMIPVLLAFYVINRFVPVNDWIGLIVKIGGGLLVALPYCYLVVMNQAEKNLIVSVKNKIFGGVRNA